MKRIIALLLSCLMLLTACSEDLNTEVSENNVNISENETIVSDGDDLVGSGTVSYNLAELNADHIPEYYHPDMVEFNNLDDPELLSYVENQVTMDLMNELDSDEYILKDIAVTYVSKEYIEELSYNSRTNIFFGYSLEELDQQFQGTRYVFTLGEDGETIVTEFEEYSDTYNQILKNIAIGTGVILIYVTVECVTAGAGTPAITYIFAGSAASAAKFAISSAAISGGITAGVTAYTTGDWEEALEQGALSASEGFKWGAIIGGVSESGNNALILKIASSNGLTMDDAALILSERDLPICFLKQISSYEEYKQLLLIAEKGGWTIEEMSNFCMRSGYPLEIVKLIRTTAEGNVYFEEAGLTLANVGDRLALVREIDLTYKSELAGEIVTNLERMRRGYAAIDPITGEAYELHHIGQSIDSPLAILRWNEHRDETHNSILHDLNIADGTGVHALLSDTEWAAQRKQFWMDFAQLIENGL